MKLSSAARRTFRKQIKTYVKARHDQVYLKCHTAITSHLLMHHAYVRFFFQLFKSMIRNIFYENRNTLKNKRERVSLWCLSPPQPPNPSFQTSQLLIQGSRRHRFSVGFLPRQFLLVPATPIDPILRRCFLLVSATLDL